MERRSFFASVLATLSSLLLPWRSQAGYHTVEVTPNETWCPICNCDNMPTSISIEVSGCDDISGCIFMTSREITDPEQIRQIMNDEFV